MAITTKKLIAEEYIVSSSVTLMTQSLSSGSTVFGDSGDDTHVFSGSIGINSSRAAYPIDLQTSDSPATLNIKLNAASTTSDYAEIAFQLWEGAGTGANTFGGSGTSRPSVVLRALNEAGNTAAGAFVVGTFTGGSTNSALLERFRISSAGNVGIGETNPQYPLEVVGATGNTVAKFGQNFALHAIHNSPVLGFNLYYNTAYKFGEGSSNSYGGYIALSPSTGKFSLATSNQGNADGTATMTERVTVLNSGNVGIGTASPTKPLHVYHATTNIAGLFQSGDSQALIAFRDNTTGDDNHVMVGADGTNFVLSTDNTERLRVDSLGNVGIGATSMTTGFAPNLTIEGGSPALLLRDTTSSNTATQFYTIYSANGDIKHYFDHEKSLNFATSTDNLGTGESIKLKIDGATGNVGIGTTSPDANLHISSSLGSSTSSLHIEGSGSSVVAVDGTQGRLFSITDELSGSLFSANTISGLPVIEAFSDNKVTLGPFSNPITVTATGNISGSATSTGSFGSVHTAGHIGVGTTNPLSPLHQVGSGNTYPGEVRVGGSSTAFGVEIKFDQSGATVGTIYSSPGYGNDNALLKIGVDSGGTNQLVLKGDGNVGIGTASPDAPLHVKGGTANTAKFQSDSGATNILFTDSSDTLVGQLEFSNSSTGLSQLVTRNTSMLRLGVNNAAVITISGSNVGIGTNSPSAISGDYQLHLHKQDSNHNYVHFTNTTTGLTHDDGLLVGINGDEQVNFWNREATDMNFATSNGLKMVIQAGGNVGIGSSNPGNKLDVVSTGDTVIATKSTTNSSGNDAIFLANVAGSSGGDPMMRFNIDNVGAWTIGVDNSDGDKFKISGLSAVLGTNDRLTIDTSGKVGIGITNPTGSLHVMAAQPEVIIQNSTQDGSSTMLRLTEAPVDGRAGGYLHYDGSANKFHIGTHISGTDTKKITILRDSTVVGIGTDAPVTALLHAYGANNSAGTMWTAIGAGNAPHIVVQNGGTTSNNNAGYFFKDNDGYVGGVGMRFTDHNPNKSKLIFSTANTNTREIGAFNESGSLGVGLTNPEDYFHTGNQLVVTDYYDGQHAGITIVAGSSYGSRIHFADGTGAASYRGFIIYDHSSDKFQFGTSASTRMVIDSSGNVGIGTTSPDAPLSFGVTSLNEQVIKLRQNGNSKTGLGITNQFGVRVFGPSDAVQTGANFEVGHVPNDNVTSTNFTSSLAVLYNGNVGIGVTVPQVALQVKQAGHNVAMRVTDNSDTIGLDFGYDDAGFTEAAIYNRYADNDASKMTFGFGLALSTAPVLTILKSGNVGIGDETPQYALEIRNTTGDVRVSSNTDTNRSGYQSGNAGGTSYFYRESSAGGAALGGSTGYATVVGGGGAYPLQFGTNDTIKMTIDTNGYVGIGTSSPTVVLDVSGSNNLSSRMRLTKHASGTSKILQLGADRDTTAVPFIGAESNHAFDIITNNTQRVRVDTSGNVGIGTTGPTQKLDIRGGNLIISASGGSGVIFKGTGDGSNKNALYFKNASNTEKFRIIHDAAANGTNDLQIKANASSVQVMTMLQNGHVGIGTASPTEELTVFHSTDPMINLRISTHDNAALILGDADGMKLYGQGASQQIRLYSETTEVFRINQQEAVFNEGGADLDFRVEGDSNSNLFTIDGGNERVGIGVSPATKLHVKGAGEIIRIENDTNAVGNTFVSFYDTSALKGYVGFTGGSTDHLVLYNNENADVRFFTNQNLRMTVAAGGNVGIGDAAQAIAPSFPLTVAKSTSDPVAFFGYSQVNAEDKHGLIVIQSGTIPQSGGDLSGEAGIIFRHSGGTGGSNFDGNAGSIKSLKMDTYAGTGQAHNRLAFSTTFNNTDSEKMTILDSGNVGIGNASPATHLHINGSHVAARGMLSLESTDHAIINLRGASGNNSGIEFYNGTNQKWAIANRADASDKYQIRRGSDDAVAISIDQSLNVGIGTTSPNRPLDVRRSSDGIALELHSTVGDADEFVDFKMISGNATAGTLGTIFRHQRQGSGGGDMIIFTNPLLTSTPLETIRFTSDQKVGIGTTSPDGPLHVVGGNGNQLTLDNGGEQYSQLNLANNGTHKAFMTYDNTNKVIAIGAQGNVAGFDYIGFRPKGSTDVMVISGSGVGIGVTSPSAKLQVKGADGLNSTETFTLTDGNGNNLFTQFNGGKAHFNYGPVGIGLTGPERALHVHALTNDYVAKFESSDGYAGIILEDNSSTNDGNRIAAIGDSLRFDVGNSAKVYIDSNGLGVGASPGHAGLDVSAGHISVDTAFSMKFDGPSGGDSISSPSANTLQFMTGGAKRLIINDTQISGSQHSTASFGMLRVMDIKNQTYGNTSPSEMISTLNVYADKNAGPDQVVGHFLNDEASVNDGDSILRLEYSDDSSITSAQDFITFYNQSQEVGSINSQVAYSTFTGMHVSQRPSGSDFSNWKPGMVVKSTGKIIHTSSISNAWPEVELTSTQKDKACVGVFSYTSSMKKVNGLDSTLPRIYYNAIGEGLVRVTDTGGNIEVGDYICSSTRAGHGEKQDDDLLHNYTVAKATQPYNFASASNDSELGYKSVLIGCTYHCG